MSSTSNDHDFLAQVADLKKRQEMEMNKLLISNGRINADGMWCVTHGGSVSFDTLDDFSSFVDTIYGHMVEELIGGYRDTRVIIPGVPYTIMNVDFYLGEDASGDADFTKDLVAVSIKMVDILTGIPRPNREYRVIRYRENENDVKDVFASIKTEL